MDFDSIPATTEYWANKTTIYADMITLVQYIIKFKITQNYKRKANKHIMQNTSNKKNIWLLKNICAK